MVTGIITAMDGIMAMVGGIATVICILVDIRTAITHSVMAITGSVMVLVLAATDLTMVSATVTTINMIGAEATNSLRTIDIHLESGTGVAPELVMVVPLVTVVVVGLTAVAPFDDNSRGIAVPLTPSVRLTMPTIVIVANDWSPMAMTVVSVMMSTHRNAAWADLDLCHRRS